MWINEDKDVEALCKFSIRGKLVAITITTHLASRVNAKAAWEVLMFQSSVIHIQIHGHDRDSNNIKWKKKGREPPPMLEPHPICKYNKLSYASCQNKNVPYAYTLELHCM